MCIRLHKIFTALYAICLQVNICVCSMFVRANKKVAEQLQLEWQKQKTTTMLTNSKQRQNKNCNLLCSLNENNNKCCKESKQQQKQLKYQSKNNNGSVNRKKVSRARLSVGVRKRVRCKLNGLLNDFTRFLMTDLNSSALWHACTLACIQNAHFIAVYIYFFGNFLLNFIKKKN